MVSSLTLAFEDVSLDYHPIKKQIIDCLNNFYTVVFLLELMMKMFAFGVKGYFESAWHWLDSIVVAVSLGNQEQFSVIDYHIIMMMYINN